jgi:diguanylate cyclase (GGDEF)-like protein
VSDVLRLEDDRETSAPSDPRAPRRQVLVARDGSRRPVEVTSSPIFAASGAPHGRVWVLRDAKDLAAYEARLRDLAFKDGLTGLSNRRALEERLDLELARARRAHSHLALLFIDLDRFKSVNDTFGHRVGDQLLVAVAERLLGTLRQADTIARMSGDEFCVLVPDVTDVATAEQVAFKVLEALVRPVVLEGVLIPIASSIGVAVFPDHASGAEELLRVADLAMYRAKGLGGAGLAVHEGPARRFTPRHHQGGSNDGERTDARTASSAPAGAAAAHEEHTR